MPSVLVNTLPPSIPAGYKQHFGNGFEFGFDPKIKGNLLFQVQVWFMVRHPDTNDLLYEYRTLSSYTVTNQTDRPGFYEAMYQLILASIAAFNDLFGAHACRGIIERAYTPPVMLQQALQPLRQAIIMLNFGGKLSNN